MCNVDGVELPESTAQLHHVVHNPNQTCSSFVMRPGSVLYVGSGCTPWSLCHARCDVAGVVTVAGAAYTCMLGMAAGTCRVAQHTPPARPTLRRCT